MVNCTSRGCWIGDEYSTDRSTITDAAGRADEQYFLWTAAYESWKAEAVLDQWYELQALTSKSRRTRARCTCCAMTARRMSGRYSQDLMATSYSRGPASSSLPSMPRRVHLGRTGAMPELQTRDHGEDTYRPTVGVASLCWLCQWLLPNITIPAHPF
jgi:hypothetical protein